MVTRVCVLARVLTMCMPSVPNFQVKAIYTLSFCCGNIHVTESGPFSPFSGAQVGIGKHILFVPPSLLPLPSTPERFRLPNLTPSPRNCPSPPPLRSPGQMPPPVFCPSVIRIVAYIRGSCSVCPSGLISPSRSSLSALWLWLWQGFSLRLDAHACTASCSPAGGAGAARAGGPVRSLRVYTPGAQAAGTGPRAQSSLCPALPGGDAQLRAPR